MGAFSSAFAFHVLPKHHPPHVVEHLIVLLEREGTIETIKSSVVLAT